MPHRLAIAGPTVRSASLARMPTTIGEHAVAGRTEVQIRMTRGRRTAATRLPTAAIHGDEKAFATVERCDASGSGAGKMPLMEGA